MSKSRYLHEYGISPQTVSGIRGRTRAPRHQALTIDTKGARHGFRGED